MDDPRSVLESIHYACTTGGQAWHIELDRPEQGFQSIGSRAVMGKEMLRRIAELQQQAAAAVTTKIKQSQHDLRSQQISKLRAQSLREAAAAALAEYSCTVVEELSAFSRQLLLESCGPQHPLFKGFSRGSRLHRVLMRYEQLDYALTEAVNDEHIDDLSRMRIVWTAGEGVSTAPSEHNGKVITAWSVLNGVASRPFQADLGEQLCIQMFETSTQFHLGVHRVQMRPPPGRDRAAAAKLLVQAWHTMYRAEKVRQLHTGDFLMQNLPESWGPCDKLEAMPCVVWLNPGKSKQRRVEFGEAEGACVR